MLEVTNLRAGYGSFEAVSQASVSVPEGQFTALLGGNGAGKSTLLKCIVGELTPWSGEIRLGGTLVVGKKPHELAAQGMRMLPQGHQVLGPMTVRENLEMGAYLRNDKHGVQSDLEMCLTMFPRLRERQDVPASSLSGGERAFLGVAQMLMSRPHVLLLDEPSAGLAPGAMGEVFDRIAELQRERNLTILLVEQNAHHAMRITNYAYVMADGRIVREGSSRELAEDPEVHRAYLAY